MLNLEKKNVETFQKSYTINLLKQFIIFNNIFYFKVNYTYMVIQIYEYAESVFLFSL